MILGIDKNKLKAQNGYCTANEINQQPIVWIEAIRNIEKNKDDIKKFVDKFSKEENIKIILSGAGTSAFSGETCALYIREVLGKNVEAIATTDIVANPTKYLKENEAIVLVSFARSGNSPESVATVELAKKIVKNLYQIVITCNEDGELAKRSKFDDKSLTLLMPKETNDKGFAMTSSFTTMIISCISIFNINNIDKLVEDVKSLSISVENFINDNKDKINMLSKEDFERIIYLGADELKAISRESALKVLELTSGKVNASYDTPLGFRHGPKSVINEKSMIVVYLSNNYYTRLYDIDLIKEVCNERKGNKVTVVGSNIPNEIIELVDYSFKLEDLNYISEGDVLVGMQQIIFGQMLSFYKSYNLNITPDNPCPTGEVNRVVKGVIIHRF